MGLKEMRRCLRNVYLFFFGLINIPSAQVQSPEFLTQLTLDASAVLDIEQCEKDIWGLLELQTREYISKIHHKRISELKRLSVF